MPNVGIEPTSSTYKIDALTDMLIGQIYKKYIFAQIIYIILQYNISIYLYIKIN